MYFVSLFSPMLSESLFDKSHEFNDSSSVLAMNKRVFMSLWNKNRFMSSANNFGVALEKAYWMSFTYIRNSKGPSTEPCGTPQLICEILELVPFT